ncbi:MAG TPA: SRPBCC family protein [Steroidobacteraceae bacterium]|nr:SRPBCC family protein [Steroidobacteraceae bacterium]
MRAIRNLMPRVLGSCCCVFAAAAAAVAPAASGPAASAPADYAAIVLNIEVDRPADAVWKKVGGFCDIAAWLKLSCVYTSGTGDLGTVRRLAGRIDEVMVARTALSYTYAQPASTIFYHGMLEVVPEGRAHSRIHYTLLYDQAADGSDDAKARDRAQRTRLFTQALVTMKKLAEGG